MKIKFRKLKNGVIRVHPPHTIWNLKRALKKQERDEFTEASKIKKLMKQNDKIKLDDTDVYMSVETPKGEDRINFGVPDRIREKLKRIFGFTTK